MRSGLLLLFLAVIASFGVQAESASIAEIPFKYREGLLWVDVRMPASDKPLHFLLDSGAGVSVINLETARRIGLKPGREVPVSGVGKSLTGYWQRRVTARAGDVLLPSEYLTVDLNALSQSCETPVDGLIGLDFFRGRIVQIDFVEERIRLLKSAPADARNEVPLKLYGCGMRVPIAVDSQAKQWFRLDTGCATALQWVTKEVNAAQCSRQTAIGLAAVSILQTTTTVEFGHNSFTDVRTGLHQSAIFPGEAGLLGNGLLTRFSQITIDAKRARLILGAVRPPPPSVP